jgi:hypothetical protein
MVIKHIKREVIMNYTLMNANNTQDLYTIFKYVNDVASVGLFFLVMLGIIWVVSIVSLLSAGRRAPVAFTVACFISFITSLLMSIMLFINPVYMYFMGVLTGIGAIWIKLSGGFE